MANIPGGQGVLPGVFTNVVTQSAGVSVPGGLRIASIIGTGQRNQIIISSALGGGLDGFDPTYTSSNGADGRHFELATFPIISNRTQVFKNGLPLVGIEQSITPTATVPLGYDYAVDITTGHLLLQSAALVSQGAASGAQVYYVAALTNAGQGSVGNLKLVDTIAPSENWTIKCISVQRNNFNQPIQNTAVFVAFGSVSGNVVSSTGNTFTWVANGQVVSNGILSFSISETQSGGNSIAPFQPGDYFSVQVSSGVLGKNDSLTATYIGVGDINNPTFRTSMSDVTANHGTVTLDNTLSLGCQLAFANSPPGIMCVQAAPPLPRRTSDELETSFPALSVNVNDFLLPFAPGVVPDTNSDIHIFVTNPTTLVETQLLPNKFPFYTLGTSGQPTVNSFVFDNASPPAGNSFSYSVITQPADSINFGQDGYLNSNLTSQTNAFFNSPSIPFNGTYLGKNLVVIDANNLANIGTFGITGETNGVLQVSATEIFNSSGTPVAQTPPFPVFVNDTSVTFQLFNPTLGTSVPASSGSDGTLVSTGNAQAHFSSTAINFNVFAAVPLTNLQLQVVSSTTGSNIGYFDVLSYNSGSNTLTISKTFISEHSLKFEVQDPTAIGYYLTLNHNVVPNGNSLRITFVNAKDASFYDAGWEEALASLETQQIDILVTLPQQTISAIFQAALIHCQTMSNIRNKKERVLYLGAINGLTPANLTGAKLAAVESLGVLEGIQGNTVAEILAGDTEDLQNYGVANSYGDTYRAVYFFPDQIVVSIGADNNILDGFYIAAAAAGYTSGIANVASPLTNKVIAGFTILNDRVFSELINEQLAAAGVCVLGQASSGGNILWGITTTNSGFVEEQEISIVFIRDAIAKAMRAGLQGFIGIPQDTDTIGSLIARSQSLLNGFVGGGLITAYTGLNVVQDNVDPTQIDVSVKVQPVYPFNFCFVTIDVGTI